MTDASTTPAGSDSARPLPSAATRHGAPGDVASDLPADLTDDAFLGGRLMILQPRQGYRAGLDAVLLAAAAPLARIATPRQDRLRVLDAGAGVGVVGLCLARRVAHVEVTLVERDRVLAGLARDNAARNGLSARVRVIEADLTAPLSTAPELAARAGSFDLVLSNPPYHDAGEGTPARDLCKAASHAMPAGNLERWLRFLASMARPDGALAMIHRAEALADVLSACSRRFGALCIKPLHARDGADANRILVTGTKGSHAPLRLAAGAALHTASGTFCAEIEAVLRDGTAFPVD